MYPTWVLMVSLLLIFGWLGYLTYQFWKVTGLLEKLFPSGEGSFKTTLSEVLRRGQDLERFKKQNLKNIQKVALNRYNPYEDTGGDQSFSAALLDGMGDGLVITSLHARSGTRVFAKPVKGGDETKVKFSKEEKQLIKEAINI